MQSKLVYFVVGKFHTVNRTIFHCLPGMKVKGIYRVSGNKADVESVQQKFEDGNVYTVVVNLSC